MSQNNRIRMLSTETYNPKKVPAISYKKTTLSDNFLSISLFPYHSSYGTMSPYSYSFFIFMIFDESELLDEERIVTAKTQPEEIKHDYAMRPERLADFIGQEQVKRPLSISMEAAKKRQEPMEHLLLYGNPGLGKTTLASIVAKEMEAHMTITAGPALERVGDLAAILSHLGKGDVLFIDEIHRINRTIEEVLYTAMEDYAIDIIVGKGPGAKTLRMPVEPFTLVGATTKLHLLSNPLRDRFGHLFHLDFYTPSEIDTIIQKNASRLGITIPSSATSLIGSRSRHTPRIANRLLRRVRDYAQVTADGIITDDLVINALSLLQIDTHGLDPIDRKLLATIIHKFQGGPVGLQTLSASIAEDIDTIETIYEPYLLQIGMLERTPRGRIATILAHQHILS